MVQHVIGHGSKVGEGFRVPTGRAVCPVCPTGRRRDQFEQRVWSPRREDRVGLVIHEAEPRVLRVRRKLPRARVVADTLPRLVPINLHQLAQTPRLRQVLGPLDDLAPRVGLEAVVVLCFSPVAHAGGRA